jgi:hypothetical protein
MKLPVAASVLSTFLILCGLPVPLAAQTVSAEGNLTFNYFSVEGFSVSDTYTIDEEVTERSGVEIGAPFRIAVPRRSQIDANPVIPDSGGVFAVTFFAANEDGTRGPFLENIQFGNATLPLMTEADDPFAARMGAAARLLETDVFRMVSAGFDGAEMLVLERVEDPPVPGTVHMVSSFSDPDNGMRLLSRATVLPHPDQEASYFVTTLINLDLVPANDLETLLATMSGRVLDSFEYVDQ